MIALDIAKDWLRYAKSDLNTASHMFNNVNPKETEISCFHTQQCAEKSLKAYLALKNIAPPRTHDLLEQQRHRNHCLLWASHKHENQRELFFHNHYPQSLRYCL